MEIEPTNRYFNFIDKPQKNKFKKKLIAVHCESVSF